MLAIANNKIVALSVSAGQALKQGSVLQFAAMPDGSGRLQAFQIVNSGNWNFGTFLAYWISPDSQDVEFIGQPESTTFTENTATGISGGTLNIASGTEFVALGGSHVALVRMDGNHLANAGSTPVAIGSLPAPATVLKIDGTSGFLDPNGTIPVNAGLVVQNDIATVVVLLG